MNSIRHKMYQIHDRLHNENRVLAALRIKNTYLGKDQKVIMLLEIFQEHNDKVEKLIGKDFTAGTAERYRTAKKHIAPRPIRKNIPT